MWKKMMTVICSPPSAFVQTVSGQPGRQRIYLSFYLTILSVCLSSEDDCFGRSVLCLKAWSCSTQQFRFGECRVALNEFQNHMKGLVEKKQRKRWTTFSFSISGFRPAHHYRRQKFTIPRVFCSSHNRQFQMEFFVDFYALDSPTKITG